jgi:hypothetical protein
VAIERPSGLIVDALLQSFWPGATEVFADVDSPIGLAFILRYPTPRSAARLGPKRMAAFCARHAYSGRRRAQELLEQLHQTPTVALGELEMQAKSELALSLARTLDRLVDQIRLLTRRIEHHVSSIDDGRILMMLPARRAHLRSPNPGQAWQCSRVLRQ